MADSGHTTEGRAAAMGEPATVALIAGWAVTGIGGLVIAVTVAASLYLMVTAESGFAFAGWFFAMLFFGAFPAMMGLGLIVWGGRIVRRARTKRRPD